MNKIKLPDWTKDLPDHTIMTARDIFPMFGLARANSQGRYIDRGLIPTPDVDFAKKIEFRGYKTKLGHSSSKYGWTLGLLRLCANEQIQAQKSLN